MLPTFKRSTQHGYRIVLNELGSLAVRESVFEGQFQPPKTQRALRTIPLGPRAVAALTAHRQRVTRVDLQKSSAARCTETRARQNRR